MPVFSQPVFADEEWLEATRQFRSNENNGASEAHFRDPQASGSNTSAAQVPEVHPPLPAGVSPYSPVPPEPAALPSASWTLITLESQVNVLRENYEVVVLGPGPEPGTVKVEMSAKL